MIKDVIIKKIAKNSDSRGWLAEIYRSDEIDFKPSMSYVSVTKSGIVRGPHEHKHQADCFVFEPFSNAVCRRKVGELVFVQHVVCNQFP